MKRFLIASLILVLVWSGLMAAEMAVDSRTEKSVREVPFTIYFSAFAVTENGQWINLSIDKLDCKGGRVVLDCSTTFQKAVVLREVIIKSRHGVYEEVFDLDGVFGDDKVFAGHRFRKGEYYGFGVQLGLFRKHKEPDAIGCRTNSRVEAMMTVALKMIDCLEGMLVDNIHFDAEQNALQATLSVDLPEVQDAC